MATITDDVYIAPVGTPVVRWGDSGSGFTGSTPPAPPPPAPAAFTPTLVVETGVDLANLVVLMGYHRSTRYERQRKLEVLRGDSIMLEFHAFDFAVGGAQNALRSSRYTLLVDGVERAAVNVVAGVTKQSAFDVDLRGLSAGWHRLEIGGLAPGETTPMWFAYRLAGPVVEPPWMPVVRGTYDWTNHQVTDPPSYAAHALVPSRYVPTPRPLPRREYVPFATPVGRNEMMVHNIVPVRFGDSHRPNVNPEGVVSSFDRQAYFWSDMIRSFPLVPCLDGPRGVGTLAMVTHVEIGVAEPDGIPRNNLYATDPWRVLKISEDGTIKTLAGYRHRGLMTHWEGSTVWVGAEVTAEPEPKVELVGDWSAIPPERRGFHELWGMAWDESTLAINETADRIPSENNDRPHVSGPVMFVADSQNNRICRIEFSATSHATPAKVTEFITGIQDPWDIVYYDHELFVTERGSHRIAAYDATTGAYLRTVVQGAALATINAQIRQALPLAPLEDIRLQPCVAPEGLYKLKDDPWLYFGSLAMQQVKRVNLDTGAVEVVCEPHVDGITKYFKIAISDGTFGPRGTVFVWSWSNRQFGWPWTWVPPPATFGSSQVWNWYEQGRFAGQWTGANYTTAGAVARGRLVSGGAQEGLSIISKRQPADPAVTAAAERGEKDYFRRALDLLHGRHGFGYYGLPLPWGVTADIDAYLTLQGHVRPPA